MAAVGRGNLKIVAEGSALIIGGDADPRVFDLDRKAVPVPAAPEYNGAAFGLADGVRKQVPDETLNHQPI